MLEGRHEETMESNMWTQNVLRRQTLVDRPAPVEGAGCRTTLELGTLRKRRPMTLSIHLTLLPRARQLGTTNPLHTNGAETVRFARGSSSKFSPVENDHHKTATRASLSSGACPCEAHGRFAFRRPFLRRITMLLSTLKAVLVLRQKYVLGALHEHLCLRQRPPLFHRQRL